MNSRSLYTATLMLALVASFSADRASAYCRMTPQGGPPIGDSPCAEAGEPLIWKNPCLSYAIDYRGTVWMDFEGVESAVDAAFEAWETADCGGSTPGLIFKRLESSTCQRAEFNATGNVNTITFLDPFKDPCADADEAGYDPFAFAVTIVWHNTATGEVLDADMMINDQLATRSRAGGPYANCPDTGCLSTDADLASIVTHQVGHFIGVGHSNVIEATMHAAANRGSVEKRTLAQDDIDAVCDIYPPGNLDQSCDATPMGGLELNCETNMAGDPIACDDPAPPPEDVPPLDCGTNPAGDSSACDDPAPPPEDMPPLDCETNPAGDPDTCDEPASFQGGTTGCSPTRTPADGLWAALLAALLGLTVLRRRAGA